MKNCHFLFIILLFNLSCNKHIDCAPDQTINIGRLKNNWIYVNEELKIKMALPLNWYITTYQESNSQITVPIKTEMPSNLIQKSNITLKNVLDRKNSHEPLAIFPVFFISSIDPQTLFNNEGEKKSLGFCIVNSSNQNEDKDLEQLINDNGYQKYTPQKTELDFGTKEKLKCIKISINRQGKTASRIIGLKNYGCYNLFITIDYSTETGLKDIKKILSDIKQ
ncbi:hypothetical protein [Flavobacterium hungaricum]|uniref:Lipoprotein n=1 Tax=Flavobacterium hungaricum TaxID=2082725 RepID=A0ABR9TE40_9FLAO|nr:hypothetical protein [Flavobacterium hungaricum]MBE8723623.1 hypothetical protein [Flavobacterium hungaricum]